MRNVVKQVDGVEMVGDVGTVVGAALVARNCFANSLLMMSLQSLSACISSE